MKYLNSILLFAGMFSISSFLVIPRAVAGEIMKKSSVFSEPSDDSTQLMVLQKGAPAIAIEPAVTADGQDWVKIKSGAKTGYVRASNISLTEGDVGFSTAEPEEPTPVKAEKQKSWRPGIHIETSPVGDLAARYNLQISHFFTEHCALGIKGTTFKKGTQAVMGSDSGSEIGVRASYYLPFGNGMAAFGWHGGLFYANFKRGNNLDDAFGVAFQDPTVDRDIVKSVMPEYMMGPIVHWGDNFTTEILGGIQYYHVDYVTIDKLTDVQTTRKSSAWELHAVIEANIGMAF